MKDERGFVPEGLKVLPTKASEGAWERRAGEAKLVNIPVVVMELWGKRLVTLDSLWEELEGYEKVADPSFVSLCGTGERSAFCLFDWGLKEGFYGYGTEKMVGATGSE